MCQNAKIALKIWGVILAPVIILMIVKQNIAALAWLPVSTLAGGLYAKYLDDKEFKHIFNK